MHEAAVDESRLGSQIDGAPPQPSSDLANRSDSCTGCVGPTRQLAALPLFVPRTVWYDLLGEFGGGAQREWKG